MTKERADSIVKGINSYLASKQNHYDVYEGFSDEHGITIQCDISWGDWRHDHKRIDWLIDIYCTDHSLTILSSTEDVYEDDGSDCYSAIHTWKITE